MTMTLSRSLWIRQTPPPWVSWLPTPSPQVFSRLTAHRALNTVPQLRTDLPTRLRPNELPLPPLLMEQATVIPGKLDSRCPTLLRTEIAGLPFLPICPKSRQQCRVRPTDSAARTVVQAPFPFWPRLNPLSVPPTTKLMIRSTRRLLLQVVLRSPRRTRVALRRHLLLLGA